MRTRQHTGYGIALLAALLISSSVSAQTPSSWRPVTGSDDTLSFLDANRMVRDGDKVTVWRLVFFDRQKTVEIFRRYNYGLFHDVMDCAARRMTTLSMNLYGDADVIDSIDGDRIPTDVVPESNGENLLSAACTGQFGNTVSFPSIETARSFAAFHFDLDRKRRAVTPSSH